MRYRVHTSNERGVTKCFDIEADNLEKMASALGCSPDFQGGDKIEHVEILMVNKLSIVYNSVEMTDASAH